MSDLGNIARSEAGGFILCYERRFDKPPSDVWAALTDPAILTRWLSRADVELRVGGRFAIYFFEGKETMSGTIQRIEPERLIEYTWIEDNSPPSLVRWTIVPDGNGCRLTLTHILPPGSTPELVIELGGGWHAILGYLDTHLRGEPTIYDVENLRALEVRYGELFKRTEPQHIGVPNDG